jgi:hypothetical protein
MNLLSTIPDTVFLGQSLNSKIMKNAVYSKDYLKLIEGRQ